MKTLTNVLKKTGLIASGILMTCANVQAATYTAVTSGNFNTAATWGGIAPAALLTTDVIIIPSGITVTLSGSETFAGTSTLVVNGSLTSGTFATGLIMTGGNLAGSGMITVDSLVLGATTGITFLGSATARAATSMGTAIPSATDISVTGALRLQSGVLNIGAGSLTVSSGGTLIRSGGSVAVSGVGILDLTAPYHVKYTSAVMSGLELMGPGLQNVTVDVPGGVTMTSDVLVNGMIMLTSGNLILNDHKLTFGAGGNIAASGMGAISSTILSDIVINAAGSFTGPLRFTSGGSMINNFIVNFGTSSGNVALGSNVSVNGNLGLQMGKIVLGANSLMLGASATVSGGNVNSYVIADGAGKLTMNLAASGTAMFSIGTAAEYLPLLMTAASGSASGDVSANVMNNVYAGGTSGTLLSATEPVVNATWYVSSSAAGAYSYNMQVMWSAGMEVNGFDHTQAYISHYTGGAWDIQPTSASVLSGSMYAMTRSSITSLSPFMVSDVNTGVTATNEIYLKNVDITLYPNPVANTLYFTGDAKVEKIAIVSMDGRIVKKTDGRRNWISVEDLQAGTYSIYFSGKGFRTTRQFLKQ